MSSRRLRSRAGRGGEAEGGRYDNVVLEEMVRFKRNDDLRLELTKQIVKENLNVLHSGHTILHIAAHTGNIEAIQLLLDAGANINILSNEGDYPLDRAVHSNQQKASIFLLEKGAQFTNAIYTKDRYWNGDIWTSSKNTGRTLLHWAARLGSCPAINAVLSQEDTAINIPNDSGTTALHMACIYGHEDAIEFLVSHGASFQPRDSHGKSPLDKCKGGSDGPLATRLREKYFPLHNAIRNDDLPLVLALLHGGDPVLCHVQDEAGLTPFQYALVNSKKEICHALFFHTTEHVNLWALSPSEINRIREYLTTPCGHTPLSFLGKPILPLVLLAGQNNVRMIDWLINIVYQLPDSENNPLITSADLDQALIHAAQRHCDLVMVKLAEYGANVYQHFYLDQPGRDAFTHLGFGRVLPLELIQNLKEAHRNSSKFQNWIRRRNFLRFLSRCNYYTGPSSATTTTTTSSSSSKNIHPTLSMKVTMKDQVFSLDICVVTIMGYI